MGVIEREDEFEPALFLGCGQWVDANCAESVGKISTLSFF
jgi:hypothetical protein